MNIRVKINELQMDFEQQKKITTENLEDEIKKEALLRNTLQKCFSYTGTYGKEFSPELSTLIEDLKIEIKKASQLILDRINVSYYSNFSLDDVMSEREGFFYHHGIMETLNKKGYIDKLFQDVLTDIIPSHPKDEYPETRAMYRKFYIHCGPTNSGKTFQSLEALKEAPTGAYLSPLRLLALEVYEKLNQEGTLCDLRTGEEEILVPFAHHTACTIEKLDFNAVYDTVVIDEGQMLANSQRGSAWTRAILGVKAQHIHICCALQAVPLLQKLIRDCKDECEVFEHERQCPLVFEKRAFDFPKSVEPGDALIVFSRRMALQVASVLADQGITSSVIYRNLPPETRRKQVDMFLEKKTKVVVSTDAIGMGLNLPVRRVVFLETSKFDGSERRDLEPQEIKQIGGRAGRRGMYEQGFVSTIENRSLIATSLEQKDVILEQACLAPMEQTILSLPFGNLKARLEAFSKYNLPISYISKVDISEPLERLEQAQRFEELLSIEQMYRAIHIPFNHKDENLSKLWLHYLKELASGATSIAKPPEYGTDLNNLETYYRAIGLYYSFSKAFGLDFDQEWCKEEREETSEAIHRQLHGSLKTFRKKCERCKKNVPWNHIFSICDKCFEQKKR